MSSLPFKCFVNIFLGHTGTVHEDTNCGSMSEYTEGPLYAYLDKVTSLIRNRPVTRSGDLLACFRNPKGWTKVIAVQSKKTAIRWIFKQVPGHTDLGQTERKMWIVPPVPVSRFTLRMWSCSIHDFPDRPRFSGSLLETKCDATEVWMLVCFSSECGGLP